MMELFFPSNNYESFEVCVFSIEYPGYYQCKTALNTRANLDTVYIEAPTGIGRVPEGSTVHSAHVYEGPTYYDEDGNVLPSSYVKQGEDSMYTERTKIKMQV